MIKRIFNQRAESAGRNRLLALTLLWFGVVHADPSALKAGVFDPPRQAPDFTLQGSNGQELRLGSFRGKVVVLGFGFTSCANVCPTTLATLAAARRNLGAAASDVQVVYVTVDPQRDTPAQMKKYLATFDPTFMGGSGTENALAKVRSAYGIQAEKKLFGNDYTYAHSSYTYLIDRKGVLRALMPYGHAPSDYVHDLNVLLAER
ncbi:MAG: SCO family protein [Povalibacter sp.]